MQAGSYCPNPLTSLPCPSGHFCPMQSMAPLSCSWISHCPTGSSLPQTTWGAYIGIWILIIALLLLWRAALSWLQRRRLQRLQKCRQEVIANRRVAVKDTHAAGCELARWFFTMRPVMHLSDMSDPCMTVSSVICGRQPFYWTCLDTARCHIYSHNQCANLHFVRWL